MSADHESDLVNRTQESSEISRRLLPGSVILGNDGVILITEKCLLKDLSLKDVQFFASNPASSPKSYEVIVGLIEGKIGVWYVEDMIDVILNSNGKIRVTPGHGEEK